MLVTHFCQTGWTLQELLAPQDVQFFSKQWEEIFWISRIHPSSGQDEIVRRISQASGIGEKYLLGHSKVQSASIAARMSWAARRQTTREEDRAYSLMGLFDVNMPLLYGEGEGAFIRLQEEIIRRTDDMSIFYWRSGSTHRGCYDRFDDLSGLLAPSPDYFSTSSGAEAIAAQRRSLSAPYEITNKGLKIELPLARIGDRLYLSALDCYARYDILPGSRLYVEDSSISTVGVCLYRLYDGSNHFARVYPNWIIHFTNVDAVRETIFVRQPSPPSRWNGELSDELELPDTCTQLLLSSVRVLDVNPSVENGNFADCGKGRLTAVGLGFHSMTSTAKCSLGTQHILMRAKAGSTGFRDSSRFEDLFKPRVSLSSTICHL